MSDCLFLLLNLLFLTNSDSERLVENIHEIEKSTWKSRSHIFR